jgi:hypothetical protein
MSEAKQQRGGKRKYDPAAMDAALQQCWNHKAVHGSFPGFRPTAKAFSVPSSSLRRLLLTGVRKTDDIAAARRPFYLEKEIEHKLVIWIIIMFCVGRSLYRRHVESKIYSLAQLSGKVVIRVRRSKSWWKAFCSRWPCLGLRRPSKLERQRALNTNPVTIKRFFELLKVAMELVKPQAMLNCDESGVNAWSSQGNGKVFGLRGTKEAYTKTSNNRNHLTVIGTIGILLGTVIQVLTLPLYYIFKGVKPRVDVLLHADSNSKAAFTKRGWICAELFADYMKDLCSQLPPAAFPALLLFDGHDTHCDYKVLDQAMEKGVFVLKLPSHTTHVLQPLDVLIFGSFKKQWANELATWFHEHPAQDEPTQPEVVAMLKAAWRHATDSSEKIQAAFAKPGLYPMDPDKLQREGKLTPSVPTAQFVTIPVIPVTSNKWKAVRDRLQEEVSAFVKERALQQIPPELQQLQASSVTTHTQTVIEPEASAPMATPISTSSSSPSSSDAAALSPPSSDTSTSSSSSSAASSQSAEVFQPTENAARFIKLLSDLVRAEHHNGNIKVSDLVPYLEMISEVAQREATARILPMPAGLKPKSLFGKAASQNGAVFYDRAKLDEMRVAAEKKEEEKKEKERLKLERKQQREERKQAKLAAAGKRKAGTKRKRARAAPPSDSDTTIPFEEVASEEEKPQEPLEILVLSDAPIESSDGSECSTDVEAKMRDSDDSMTEPDVGDAPQKRRRSSRRRPLKKVDSFLVCTQDAISDSD